MIKMNSFTKFLLCYFVLTYLVLDTVTALKLNKELVDELNRRNLTWKAGMNKIRIPSRFGVNRPKKRVPPVKQPEDLPQKMPNFYDARTRWRKQCGTILTRVRDQGYCDSGWAVATASMLSDRACIQSKGEIKRHFSARELMTCCKRCFPEERGPCVGGSAEEAINYFIETGLVTGGEVDSHEGCQPYDRTFYDGYVVENCSSSCTHPHDRVERTKGDAIYLISDEDQVRNEILTKGPVLAEIDVYEDIYYYKEGVYTHQLGAKLGVHWIKIIGYGVRDNERYWLIMNSHGKDFGRRGEMKFKRGVNTCRIEESIMAVKSVVGSHERTVSVTGEGRAHPSSATRVVSEMLLFYVFLFLYV